MNELKEFADLVYKMRSAQERYTYLTSNLANINDTENAASVLKVAKLLEKDVDYKVMEITTRKDAA